MMNRLTTLNKFGLPMPIGWEGTAVMDECNAELVFNVVDRLAAYENTELLPAEIMAMKGEVDRLTVALKLAQTRAKDLGAEKARLCEMIIDERSAHKELDEAIASENARLRAELADEKDNHASTIILRDSMYAEKDAEITRLRADLEAAKEDMHLYAQCVTCAHTYDGGMRCRVPLKERKHKGDYCTTWQWRGVRPANTPDAREGGTYEQI